MQLSHRQWLLFAAGVGGAHLTHHVQSCAEKFVLLSNGQSGRVVQIHLELKQ